MASTEELKGLMVREKIRDCVARVARGEDRRDASLLRAAFWSDAATDFGVSSGSFEDYLAWVVPGSPAIAVTQHVLGQSWCEVAGETALCETHVTAYHRVNTGPEERDSVIGGRYLDRFEKRGDEWRIAHRTMLYDWSQDFGRSIDWSQGLMGMAFSGGHYTGRAVDDHSETFFSQGTAA